MYTKTDMEKTGSKSFQTTAISATTQTSENQYSKSYTTVKEETPYEYIKRPKHYHVIGEYDVCDIANATGLDKDAYMFNVLKYVLRQQKPGEPRWRDVKKIREYCDIWLEANGFTD